jgi:hypothetical protein
MDEPKPKYVYVGPDASFWSRAIAIAGTSASPSSTSYVIESAPPRGRQLAMDGVPAAPPPITRVDPTFKLIFVSSVVLTLLTFSVWVGTAIFAADTTAARNLIAGCETISKMGFGAVFGLLGGKAMRTK